MNLFKSLKYDLSWKDIEKIGSPIDANRYQILLKVVKSIKSESFHAVLLIRLFTYFSSKKYLRLISENPAFYNQLFDHHM
jgi:hypothetical protein